MKEEFTIGFKYKVNKEKFIKESIKVVAMSKTEAINLLIDYLRKQFSKDVLFAKTCYDNKNSYIIIKTKENNYLYKNFKIIEEKNTKRKIGEIR